MSSGSMCLWVIKRGETQVDDSILNSKQIHEVLELNGFVDAMDLTNVAYRFRPDIFTMVYGRAGTIGERGCAMAHLIAYANFLQSPHKYMLVVEDDIRVMDASKMQRNLQKARLLGCDFVAGLETRKSNLTHRSNNLARGSRTPFFGTSMYVIDRVAAQKALAALLEGKGFYWQADFPPRMSLSTRFFCANDWSVTSTSNNSGNLRPEPTKKISPRSFFSRVLSTMTLTELPLIDRLAVLHAVHLRELRHAARK